MAKESSFSKTFWIFNLLFVFGTLFIGLIFGAELWINKSPSLKGKVFLILKGSTAQRGNLLGIQSHETAFGTTNRLVKKVGGVSGDRIRIIDRRGLMDKSFLDSKTKDYLGDVYINDAFIGPLFTKTEEGASLAPIKEGVIPRGCLFVHGTHPRSFDSRYSEFGLVCLKSKEQPSKKAPSKEPSIILGRACRIW